MTGALGRIQIPVNRGRPSEAATHVIWINCVTPECQLTLSRRA